MARIEGVRREKARPLVRLAYWLSRRRVGQVAEPITVTAHHPWLMRGYGAFELALERSHLVDERLKELAALKTATMVGCRFCIDIGSALGRESGVSEDQLRDLPVHEKSASFSPLEKLVIEYAARVTKTPVEVTDALFDSLRGHFSEAQLVELTGVIAFENYRARFNHAFGIEEQNFSEGAYCPFPEAAGSASAGEVEEASVSGRP